MPEYPTCSCIAVVGWFNPHLHNGVTVPVETPEPPPRRCGEAHIELVFAVPLLVTVLWLGEK